MASDIKVVFEAETAPIDRAVRLLDNLEAELRDVQRAEKQGLISKKRLNQETARLNNNISKLKSLSQGSAKDFRKFEKSLYGSGKAARANELAMQQAGYQVQDFIVQVQAGTNPLIAFSQQGSQLAGFFAGPWGAAIGLGIAAVGFLGTALLGLGEKAKSVEEQLEDLADAFDAYQEVTNTNAIEQVNKKFGRTSSVLVEIQRELNNIAKIKAMESLDESTKAFGKTLQTFKGESQEISNLFEQGFFGPLSRETARIATQIEGLSNSALPLGTRLEKALNIKDTLVENVGAYKDMNKEQKEFYNSLLLVIQRMEQAKNLTSPEGPNKTGYEGEFTGVMDHMATQTVNELQSGYEAVQRVQMGLAKSEAKRLQTVKQTAANQKSMAAASLQDATRDNAARLQLDKDRQTVSQAMHQHYMSKRAEEDKALADQTHAHMMALQKAYFDDAKTKAAEIASATYLANYNAVMGYQAYGESRSAAPTSPVEPSKISVSGPTPTTIEDTIKSYRRQMATEKALMSLTGQRRREEELFLELKYANQDADIKTSKARLRGLAEEMAAMEERSRVIREVAQEQKEMQDFISQSFESGFMSIIDGTQSVKDAFRSMARDIIAELYRVLVVKKLVSAATGFFGFADGGVFQGGSQVQAFADGGVVGGPTFFPMSGGKTGLMGEAGPEAIMPLKRGKNGKLGVEASGESGNVTVVQNFSFSANGDDSVKKIIAQEAPKIAQMTQQQILESRKRGGSFRKAFG